MGLNGRMTLQITDTCIYKRKRYHLLKTSGSGLFYPSDHGIKTEYISTACWRGFHCCYTIKKSELFLTTVHLGLDYFDKVTDAIVLFGRKPERYMESYKQYRSRKCEQVLQESSDYRIDGICEPIGFTGGILLGSDLVSGYSVAMHYPVYVFQTLHEVIFENGKVVAIFDRSKEMEEIRRFIAE
jgi:hypothetical protein